MELALHLRQCDEGLSVARLLPRSGLVACLQDALGQGKEGLGIFSSADSSFGAWGVISTAHAARTDMSWENFCLRARAAAGIAGLADVEARALVGAMMEIEENVHLHSQRAVDGFVGFFSRSGKFEFAVADSGVGVLQSLRSHSDYSNINDSGTALRVALDNGNSRFGIAAKRGTGFNSLFLALAALEGQLRFRSGDYSLNIEGVGPKLVAAKSVQRAHLQGMLASVACSPLQRSLLQ
jgi:hypothetical protein